MYEHPKRPRPPAGRFVPNKIAKPSHPVMQPTSQA